MNHPFIAPETLAEMELDDLRAAAEARGIPSSGNAPTVRSRIRKWQDANPPAQQPAASEKSDAPEETPAQTSADKEGEPEAAPTDESPADESPADESPADESPATAPESAPADESPATAAETVGNQSPAPPVLPSPTSQVVSLSAVTAPLVTAYTAAPPAQTEPTGGSAPVGISFAHQKMVAEGNTLVRLHGDTKVRKVCVHIDHGGRERANSLYGSRVASFINDEIANGAPLLPDPALAAPASEQP